MTDRELELEEIIIDVAFYLERDMFHIVKNLINKEAKKINKRYEEV